MKNYCLLGLAATLLAVPCLAAKPLPNPSSIIYLEKNEARFKPALMRAIKIVEHQSACVEADDGSIIIADGGVEDGHTDPIGGKKGLFFFVECTVNDLANSDADTFFISEDEIWRQHPPIYRLQRGRNARFYELCSKYPEEAAREYGPSALKNCRNDNL